MPYISSQKQCSGIGSARYVDVVVLQREFTSTITVSGDGSCTVGGAVPAWSESIVTLYRISPDGTPETSELGRYNEGAAQLFLSGDDRNVLPDDAGGLMASWLVCSGTSGTTVQCDRRAKYFGVNGVGNEFSLSNGVHPLNEMPVPPTVVGTGSTAFDNGGAVSMATGTRLWSKPATSSPLALLENGQSLYGTSGMPGAIFDQSGNALDSSVPLLYDFTGALGPTLFNGTSQIGWLPNLVEFGAVTTSELYLDPDVGFAAPQGGPRHTNQSHTCDPRLLLVSKGLINPRDYLFAFDDEISGFPSAGSHGVFTAAEKDMFWPEFVKWQFDGDRGFPKSIVRWNPGYSTPPNMVVRKADLLHWRLRPLSSGVTEFPEDVYSSLNGFWGPLWASQNRATEGLPDFPLTIFGILIDKQESTSTQAGTDFLRYLAVHEFGHSIGLDHTDSGCRYSSSVMSVKTGTNSGDIHPLAPTERDKKVLRKFLHIQ